MAPYPYLLLIYGFFVLGVFSGHAVYIPHPCASHRGLVLQRRRPCHHQLRAPGSRPPGCSVWRELQQTRRADDLLCAAEHLCDVSRPRDPRRPAATLTEASPPPGGPAFTALTRAYARAERLSKPASPLVLDLSAVIHKLMSSSKSSRTGRV